MPFIFSRLFGIWCSYPENYTNMYCSAYNRQNGLDSLPDGDHLDDQMKTRPVYEEFNPLPQGNSLGRPAIRSEYEYRIISFAWNHFDTTREMETIGTIMLWLVVIIYLYNVEVVAYLALSLV